MLLVNSLAMTKTATHSAHSSATLTQSIIFMDFSETDQDFPTLRQCGDRPFLAWLMREQQRFGVRKFILIAAATLPENTFEILQSHLPCQADFQCHLAANTPRALLTVCEQLQPRFLVSHQAVLFSGNMARLLSEASKKPEQTWQLRSEDSNCLLLVNRDVIPQAGASSLTWQEWKEYLLGAGKLSQISLPGKLWFPPQQSESNDSFKQLERPAVFLDRDGVINEDHGWVGTRERFHWTPNLFGALRRLTDFGYHVFIVTNQSGIARGFYTETDLHDLMTWVVDEIRKHGGTIDDWRFCPFHPNASIEQYRKTSNWRKPAPGMILDLASKWKPDLSRSVLYGDQETDLQAAINSGIPAVKVGPETLASFVDSSFPKPSV